MFFELKFLNVSPLDLANSAIFYGHVAVNGELNQNECFDYFYHDENDVESKQSQESYKAHLKSICKDVFQCAKAKGKQLMALRKKYTSGYVKMTQAKEGLFEWNQIL